MEYISSKQKVNKKTKMEMKKFKKKNQKKRAYSEAHLMARVSTSQDSRAIS